MNLPTNGNGKHKQAEIPPLPEHLEKQAQAFFSNYLARENELLTTKRELDSAHVRIRELEAEIEGLRSHMFTLESRAQSCVIERDDAKDRQVTLATVINSIQHLLRQAGVPSLEQQAEIHAAAAESEAE